VEDALLVGDFPTRVEVMAEHLKTEESVDAQCELGSELGRIVSENTDKLALLSDAVINKIVKLIEGPTREGDVKCLTSWAANVLEMIGPRAKFAVPALEKALAEAEAAEARREKSPWDDLNSDRRLDATIRSALEAIDGKPR